MRTHFDCCLSDRAQKIKNPSANAASGDRDDGTGTRAPRIGCPACCGEGGVARCGLVHQLRLDRAVVVEVGGKLKNREGRPPRTASAPNTTKTTDGARDAMTRAVAAARLGRLTQNWWRNYCKPRRTNAIADPSMPKRLMTCCETGQRLADWACAPFRTLTESRAPPKWQPQPRGDPRVLAGP